MNNVDTRGATLLSALHSAAKTAAGYGPRHNMTHEACDRLLDALTQVGIPCRMQLVAGCAFVNRRIVPIEYRDYTRVRQLSAAAGRLGANEFEFRAVPPIHELRQWVQVVGEALAGGTGGIEDLVVSSIRWRELTGVTLGEDGERVDPELYAITQAALGIESALRAESALNEDPAWPWSEGLAVVRHVERGLDADAGAVGRAIEMSGAPWDASRAAFSAARTAAQATQALGIAAALRRAITHAAFALTMLAARTRDDGPTEAARTFTNKAHMALRDDVELSSHRLRVLAAVAALHEASDGALYAIGSLLRCATTLELSRIRSPYPPTRVELVAHGLESLDPTWMRVVVQCEGALPPGSRVRLADGRLGVVLGVGDGAAPWRPRVLVGSEIIQPQRDVQLAEVR